MHYQIKQIDKSDCGFTCLKIILAHFHHCSGYLFVDNKYRRMNLLEIKNELGRNFLSSDGIKFTDLSLLKKKKYLIVQIEENNAFHFVVFIKQISKYVLIFDPKAGKRILKFKYFEKIFTKNSIMVNKRIKKAKIKTLHLIEYRYLVSYISSICLDFGLAYLLTYFIKSSINNSLLILIFTSALLNFILKIVILFAYNKKLDSKYLDELIKKRITLDEIEIVNTLKIDKINICKSVGQLFISTFIAYVLISDNYIHVFSLLTLLLIMTISLLIGNNVLLIIKEEVSQLEKNYALNPSYNCYKKLKKKSFLLTSYLLLSKVGLIITIVFFVLFLFIFENKASFPYLIFCLFTYYSFYQLISSSIRKISQIYLDLKSSYCHYLKIKDKYLNN